MEIREFLDLIDTVLNVIVSAGPYVLTVIVMAMVICVGVAIYQSSQSYKPLCKKLNKKIIRVNGSLADRLMHVIRKRAIYDFENRFEMYQDRKGNDRPEFVEYFSNLVHELRPLIFEEYEDTENDTIVYFANPMFIEWLKDCKESYDLVDFEKAVWRYFKLIDHQNREAEDARRIEEAKNEQLRLIELEKEDARNHQRLVQAIAKAKSKKSAKDDKRLIVDRYNKCVQHIHDNENHGLLPDRPQSIPIALYRTLYAARVYGNNQIYRMIDDAKWASLSAKGCYIVYNTFNGKHYIGKSDNLYVDLKQCLNGEASSDIFEFRRDLLTGHMFLVKIVPLSDSGMADLDTLHQSLCRSYKSFKPSGYNVNTY